MSTITLLNPLPAAAQLNTLAERLGNSAEFVRRQLRAVQPSDVEEMARLQSQSADDLHIGLPLTLGAVEQLLDAVTEARALVAEVTPSLQAAVERLALARRDGVRGLEDLRTIGEVMHERFSQQQENLATCQRAVDRVCRALGRLEPVVPVFLTTLARHVRAATPCVAAHEVRRCTARVVALTVELQTLRTPSEALRLASTVAVRTAELTGESIPVPVIRWPDSLLARPTLAEP